MSKLSSMDLWRLSDTLSVVDAAILIAGGDPSEHAYDDEGNREQLTWQHDGYVAAFKSLRFAILSNKLAAEVKHSMRGTVIHSSIFGDEEPYEVTELPNEKPIKYNMLLWRKSEGQIEKRAGTARLNFPIEDIRSDHVFYICREPNWKETLIDTDKLRDWLAARGLFPLFFFPSGRADSFRDKNHPRYSSKLACAIAAWEAIEKPAKGRSVKQSLQEWIQSNGVRFGVGENEVVSPTVAEEIAKVANWHTRGGANPTPSQNEDEEAEQASGIENFEHGTDSEVPL